MVSSGNGKRAEGMSALPEVGVAWAEGAAPSTPSQQPRVCGDAGASGSQIRWGSGAVLVTHGNWADAGAHGGGAENVASPENKSREVGGVRPVRERNRRRERSALFCNSVGLRAICGEQVHITLRWTQYLCGYGYASSWEVSSSCEVGGLAEQHICHHHC